MKTIDEQKNKLINTTQRQIEEINRKYIKGMRAMEVASEIMDYVMPSLKKIHLISYDNIYVNIPETSNIIGINVDMIADDKFHFYKKSYYESNWWKKNKQRVSTKANKIAETIVKSCEKYALKSHINEFSLVDEGESSRNSVLVTITFELPDA